MSKTDTVSNKTESYCIACHQKIDPRATLCSICHSHQKRWKNRLQYAANIVTLFVVSGTLIVWAAPKIRLALRWHEDVRLVACNAPLGSLVIGNYGDGDLFISHVLLFMVGRPQWEAKRIPIYRSLSPGQFLTQEIEPGNKLSVEFVDYSSEQQWQGVIQSALANKTCYCIAFFTTDDPFYQELIQIRKSVGTFDSGGYIFYYATRDPKPRKKEVFVTGTVLKLQSDQCK